MKWLFLAASGGQTTYYSVDMGKRGEIVFSSFWFLAVVLLATAIKSHFFVCSAITG
jgi:hypothetical protein